MQDTSCISYEYLTPVHAASADSAEDTTEAPVFLGGGGGEHGKGVGDDGDALGARNLDALRQPSQIGGVANTAEYTFCVILRQQYGCSKRAQKHSRRTQRHRGASTDGGEALQQIVRAVSLPRVEACVADQPVDLITG